MKKHPLCISLVDNKKDNKVNITIYMNADELLFSVLTRAIHHFYFFYNRRSR